MTIVAAMQMTSSADLARNLAEAGRLLAEARSRGALVAALPENFAFMGMSEPDKFAIAEEEGGGPIQEFLAPTARELGMWIVAGTIPMRVAGESRVAAASLVFDAQGRRAARYDKIHLFDVEVPGRDERYQESSSVRPGETPVCVDTPAGRLGLAVCYDVRFPELFRRLLEHGRRMVLPAVGVHRADRPGALGDAAARPGHREPLPRGCAGAVRVPRERPRNLRRLDDRGLLGAGAGPPAARHRRRGRRISTSYGSARSGRISHPSPTGDCRPESHDDRAFLPRSSRPGSSRSSRTRRAIPWRSRGARCSRPPGLDEDAVARVLGDVMGHAVDYADAYFQLIREESWALEDGIVKDGAHSIDQGVGVRALSGEKTGFAYSDEVVLPAMLEAAHAARAIARSGTGGAVQAWRATGGRGLYLPIDPVESMDDGAKVSLLEAIDREARALDPRIVQVMASLAASHDTILVLASDGTLAADVRPLVRLNVSVIIEHQGRREQGYAGGGGRFAYTEFVAGDRWRELVREAVRAAQVNLDAVPAPAGTMTVVLGPGWPGVLLHEAVGHGLEGDFNRKGTSAFFGRIGQQVASRGVTVVDDGTLATRRGSLNVDDEGTPTRLHHAHRGRRAARATCRTS